MLFSFMLDTDQVVSVNNGVANAVASALIFEIEFEPELTMEECYGKLADYLDGLEIRPYRFKVTKAENVEAAKVALAEAAKILRESKEPKISFSRNIDSYNIILTVEVLGRPFYPTVENLEVQP